MSPRSPEQFQALREESSERILQAALELFARHGYERTSVRAIAQEAGVSQGLLYNYFDGKAALLHAIFARIMEDIQASFARADRGTTPREKLENLIREALNIVRTRRPAWMLYYTLRMQPAVLEGLAGDLAQWIDQVHTRLQAYARDAGARDPRTDARILFALLDGIAQQYVLDPDAYPLDAVTHRVLEAFVPAGSV